MTPEEQLRALRNEERWEPTGLAPRSLRAAAGGVPPERHAAVPVLITAIVAVLVVIVSIGVIRLAGERASSPPASTPSPTVHGATAIIRGTAPTTTRTIAGVGRPGGPDAAEVARLQALATRTGRLVGEPATDPSNDVRLGAAVRSVRAAFGSALHEFGGTGPGISVFFVVLNRPPTADELQLLRLLPFTVRLSWGPRISVRERDREQQAAFAGLRGVLDAEGDTDSETDTETLDFWPDRDHPESAAQVAAQLAATITRLTGKAPTFSIEVTDRSKTPAGQAALHAKGQGRSATGVRLLIASRPTATSAEVGAGGTLGVDAQRCVALGDAVVIAPPGSAISADGRTITAKGVGTYRVATGTPPRTGGIAQGLGGTFIDATTAATYLPRGSTLCGGTSFLLLG